MNKNIAKSAVGTGAGTLMYTVPKEFRCDIEDITLSNTTASPLSVKVHLVEPGGSVSAGNMMVPNVSIPANTFVQWAGRQTLLATGFIQAIASGAGISVTINGNEYR